MYKKILLLILLLTLVSFTVPTAPVSAQTPEDEDLPPAWPIDPLEEIEKQLKNPVYPTKQPALSADPDRPSGGGSTRGTQHEIYNPWKQGSDAWGRSRTWAYYEAACVKRVYAYVWLWKWENGQYVLKDDGFFLGYCGRVHNNCDVSAYAKYSNAESASYVCTSRHIIYEIELGQTYFAEDESEHVYLTF